MIEQDEHLLKGTRAIIRVCRGIHDGVRGKESEGCVCNHLGVDVVLGDRLVLFSNSPDTYRVKISSVNKLVRLNEVTLIT